ncbi:partner of Y14 and mago isoform X1 [Pleurodeles waltl]
MAAELLSVSRSSSFCPLFRRPETVAGCGWDSKMANTPYVTDESDCHISGKYIAATQRPDGTWRKPRKVKDGYVPQEEVPVYENKYVKFFKSKPDLPPGLSPVEAPAAKPVQKADGESGLSKTAKRNLKRKEKRKQQHDRGDPDDADELCQALERASVKADVGVRQPGVDGDAKSQKSAAEGNAKPALAQPTPTADPAAVERAKKIKNLRKKLRQVEDLQQKIDSGELKELTKEQKEKLGRRQALEEELEDLELGL